MKIGITGHTSGLGKALFDYYQSLGNDCIGFSRSNGYDITSNFDSICDCAKSLDLFINNAWQSDSQTKFVQYLKDYPVNIVSIGTSAAVFYEEKIISYVGWKREYLINKKLLMDEHTKSVFQSKGSLLLINVDTLENHPSKSEVSMKFNEVIDLLNYWLVHKNLSQVNYASRNNS